MAWAWYVMLALLAVVLLCLVLVVLLLLVVFLMPLFLRLTYDGDIHLRIRILFFPLHLIAFVRDEEFQVELRLPGRTVPLYPTPPEEHPSEEETKAPAEKSSTETKPAKEGEKTPSKWEELAEQFKENDLSAILEFLQEVAGMSGRTLSRVLRATTITRLDWQMLIATGDPAETAQRYGEVCGLFYPALAQLGQRIRIRNRQVRVEPNFLLEQSSVRIDIRARMTTPRLVYAGVAFLVRFLVTLKSDTTNDIFKTT